MHITTLHTYILFVLVAILSSCTTNQKVVTDPAYTKNIQNYRDSLTLEKSKNERLNMNADDLKHLQYFNPDANYIVDCEVKVLNNTRLKEVDTYAQRKKQLKPYALLSGSIDGKKFSVTAYQFFFGGRIMEDVLFIPLTDLTSGESTYGGGRYLDTTISQIKASKLTLDFNKLYNPLCAYRSGYNCIVPPRENSLEIAINAGEKMFTGEHK